LCFSAKGAAFIAAWGSAQESVRATAPALKARFIPFTLAARSMFDCWLFGIRR